MRFDDEGTPKCERMGCTNNAYFYSDYSDAVADDDEYQGPEYVFWCHEHNHRSDASLHRAVRFARILNQERDIVIGNSIFANGTFV